jgi:hypothetical protein
MTEDNKSEPSEIDPEELRRQLADNGLPLTPNVVNGEDERLEPIGGVIGNASEGNDEGAKEVPGFEPIVHELSVLVKYWMKQIIEDDYSFFCYQQFCGSLNRRSAFANRRISRIEALIGEDAVKRAIDEAYEEFGRQEDSEAWRIFLHGTDEERRQFDAEFHQTMAAHARESDDQFYVSLLKFLAGEAHDIEPGTVGMRRAEIAKTLVDENPAWAAPENKERLLKEICDLDREGHTVVFTESEIATIEDLVDRLSEPK